MQNVMRTDWVYQPTDCYCWTVPNLKVLQLILSETFKAVHPFSNFSRQFTLSQTFSLIWQAIRWSSQFRPQKVSQLLFCCCWFFFVLSYYYITPTLRRPKIFVYIYQVSETMISYNVLHQCRKTFHLSDFFFTVLNYRT